MNIIVNAIPLTGLLTGIPRYVRCLYSGASIFAYPSLYEGFGMPVLEAMACGCPVVCSRAASMPEVAGNAAILIDPQDPDELTQVFDTVLIDSSMRNSLIERGMQRAQLFSWQKTTAQTMDVFINIAEA